MSASCSYFSLSSFFSLEYYPNSILTQSHVVKIHDSLQAHVRRGIQETLPHYLLLQSYHIAKDYLFYPYILNINKKYSFSFQCQIPNWISD